MPEEPWMEAVIKTIPKKKKRKKAKWLSEEALQMAEKRREAKSKGVGGCWGQGWGKMVLELYLLLLQSI